jgi:hypothetical protein
VPDQQGQPLAHIFVHAVPEKTGMYMPTAESDDNGRFVVEGLESGTYDVFGESDAAGYPNTALSFCGKQEPTRVFLENGDMADRGPMAGVLRGTVTYKITGKAIVSRNALHFIVNKVSNPDDSVECDGPAKFRWLIPQAVEVTLEVTAEGYQPWSYADPLNPSWLLPLRLQYREEKTLKINLEPRAQHASR